MRFALFLGTLLAAVSSARPAEPSRPNEYSENEEAMIRDERFKLVYITGRRRREDGYATAEPLKARVLELFDEQEDPDELHSLAERPAHSERIAGSCNRSPTYLRRTARQPLPATDDLLTLIDAGLAPHDVE